MIERFRGERLELMAISAGVMAGAFTYLAARAWFAELERAHRVAEVGEE